MLPHAQQTHWYIYTHIRVGAYVFMCMCVWEREREVMFTMANIRSKLWLGNKTQLLKWNKMETKGWLVPFISEDDQNKNQTLNFLIIMFHLNFCLQTCWSKLRLNMCAKLQYFKHNYTSNNLTFSPVLSTSFVIFAHKTICVVHMILYKHHGK